MPSPEIVRGVNTVRNLLPDRLPSAEDIGIGMILAPVVLYVIRCVLEGTATPIEPVMNYPVAISVMFGGQTAIGYHLLSNINDEG